MAQAKSIRSYCRSCCNQNIHTILHRESESDYSQDYHNETDYYMLQCMGCQTVSFRKDFHDLDQSYPTSDGDWEHMTYTNVYPEYLNNHRSLTNSWRLPQTIGNVYNESVTAIKADCRLLAGAGFRAVIEAVCLDKEIKGRNLEVKINNLSKAGFITKKESERLHSIRFIGNDSIHEMLIPKKTQLVVVLNIIEHLLKNIYLIDYEVEATLEKPITTYKEFEKLLFGKVAKSKNDNEFPLVKLLGKDMRRLKDNFISFEKKLITSITKGDIKNISLGEAKPIGDKEANIQHYKIIVPIPKKK